MYEDISNNRAGLGYSIGSFVSGLVSVVCLFFLPVPINFIIGAIGGVISIGLEITALYKNNQQAKELQQAVLDTNKKVNKLTPVVESPEPSKQQTQEQKKNEADKKVNNQQHSNNINNMYEINTKNINNDNNINNTKANDKNNSVEKD